jgi:hypothetical protein
MCVSKSSRGTRHICEVLSARSYLRGHICEVISARSYLRGHICEVISARSRTRAFHPWHIITCVHAYQRSFSCSLESARTRTYPCAFIHEHDNGYLHKGHDALAALRTKRFVSLLQNQRVHAYVQMPRVFVQFVASFVIPVPLHGPLCVCANAHC